MLMCIQNLVRFCQAILKILNGNELFTERQNDGKTESWKDRVNPVGRILSIRSQDIERKQNSDLNQGP